MAFGRLGSLGRSFGKLGSLGKTRSLTPAEAFLARTSGLNAAHINAYTALINGLVTDGVWPLLDTLYITATDTTANANLNLVSSSYPLTQTGTITFTADQGYSNAQSGANLDTGFNPATAPSPKFVQDSAHIAMWRMSASNFAAASWQQTGSVTKNALYPRFTDGNMYCNINSSSDDTVGIAVPTTGAGMESGSRTASTGYSYYKNGASLGTRTNTSTAVSSGVFQHLVSVATGDFGMASFGAGLDATKMLALYNRAHTYLQTIAGVP